MSGRDTAERLLFQLKSRGPQAAAPLALACGLSAMGAHKQLQALQDQGLVEAWAERAGVGRPKKLWRLTATGHGRFPDRHGELAVQLIRQVGALMGPQALEALIAARERDSAQAYAQRLAGARGLAAKVQRLAALRAEEGYLARAERAPGGRGAWLLIEDHCPICAAAHSCPGLCRSELALFAGALGEGVRIQRVEHLLAGARRCVYRIETGSPSSGPN
ncbi:transcriptional regulator [Roseateles sp. DAIF2]|uniref:helix-turn-helix transcriptional regulator n=1 Tax=Roseateles sp. DAIF2 TaxID=2714952 RepID=UPI0018A2DBCC|nr:metalloregulator ArsR/SmtB family transcription factor [Roseateles sp. DAIF2]QPF74537.1 transcriptional regulator [Roseateles sp. DAIF2]